jgi:4-amino-4-deoxy-L-arabinose transferase-like glycosyltransferase
MSAPAVSRDETSTSTATRPALSGWVTGALLTRRDALVASGIGILLSVLAVLYRSPIVPTDPWHYVRSALEFPSEDWVPLGFTRYGIILANIPPAYVFKNSEVTYYVWPVLSVFLLAACTYLLARRFWGPLAGVVSVLVLFSNTILLYNLTRGYPDVMAIALLVAAALTAVLARDRDLSGPAATWWILVTGFLLGWGFEVRETFLFAWPFVLAILWRRGRVVRTYALVLAPVLFWAALDVGISGWAYGDPLLKMHTLMGTNPTGVGSVPPPSPFAAAAENKTRWEHFLAIPQAAVRDHPDGIWMVAAGILTLLTSFARNRPLRLVGISFAVVYGINILAGGVLLPDHPFGTIVNPRYWIQYFPFIALAVGGLTSVAAAWLLERQRSRGRGVLVLVTAAVLACAVPVVTAVRYLPTVPAFAANDGNDLEQLRDAMAGQGFDPAEVWTDWETKRILSPYQRPLFGGDKVWQGKPMSLTGQGAPGPGDAVLLFSPRGTICSWCRDALEPWLDKQGGQVPSTWKLVYRDPEGTTELYRVTG